jgi:mitochondrial fission protein ELM1
MTKMDQKELRVLILRDGKPGHETKPDGFIRYLRQHAKVHLSEAQVRLPIAAIMRPLLTFMINRLPSAVWRRAVLSLYGLSLNMYRPNLVLAAGGKSSFALAACNASEGVKGLFLGSPRRLMPERLGWVFATDVSEPSSRFVQIPLPPSAHGVVSVARRQAVRESLGLAKHQKVLSVLIGGDGAGCKYSLRDWQRLAQRVATFARDDTHAVLLSTSRRTGQQTEQRLQKMFAATILHKAVWFNHLEERCIADYLAASDTVLVTIDSVSMIAEACSAGLTPWVFRPDVANLPSRVASLIDALVAQGMVLDIARNEITTPTGGLGDSGLDRFWQKQVGAVLSDIRPV